MFLKCSKNVKSLKLLNLELIKYQKFQNVNLSKVNKFKYQATICYVSFIIIISKCQYVEMSNNLN